MHGGRGWIRPTSPLQHLHPAIGRAVHEGKDARRGARERFRDHLHITSAWEIFRLLAVPRHEPVLLRCQDKDEASFNKYRESMPWPALNFSDRERATKLAHELGITVRARLLISDQWMRMTVIRAEPSGLLPSSAYHAFLGPSCPSWILSQGIPTLVVLDRHGAVVTTDGLSAVILDPSGFP